MKPKLNSVVDWRNYEYWLQWMLPAPPPSARSLTHQGVKPRDARELLERGAAVARLQNHHLGALNPSSFSLSARKR